MADTASYDSSLRRSCSSTILGVFPHDRAVWALGYAEDSGEVSLAMLVVWWTKDIINIASARSFL